MGFFTRNKSFGEFLKDAVTKGDFSKTKFDVKTTAKNIGKLGAVVATPVVTTSIVADGIEKKTRIETQETFSRGKGKY